MTVRDRDLPPDEPGNVTRITPARKAASKLKGEPPQDNASAAELAAWLTIQLGLGHDPITAATRYGHTDDSRFVFTLQSKTRITYERGAELFDPKPLVRHVTQATNGIAKPPTYTSADTFTLAAFALRLSTLVDDLDDRSEATDWGLTFLEGAVGNTVEIEQLRTPLGKWRALSAIVHFHAPVDVLNRYEVAERSIIVRDPDTLERLVRSSDIAAHARNRMGRSIAWGALHSRMSEIGWQHLGRFAQRQPGGHGHLSAHLYRIPGDWEATIDDD
jgi:hypothetical protein